MSRNTTLLLAASTLTCFIGCARGGSGATAPDAARAGDVAMRTDGGAARPIDADADAGSAVDAGRGVDAGPGLDTGRALDAPRTDARAAIDAGTCCERDGDDSCCAPEACANGRDDDGDGDLDCADADCVDAPACASGGVPCTSRIAPTDNAYLPIATCLSELESARTACNADAACALVGNVAPAGIPAGVGGTNSCRDGGSMTGLRQWQCRDRAGIPSGLRAL